MTDGVLRLELVDPAGPGALDPDRMAAALTALTDLDPGSVGAVLLANDGPNFCVGGNVAGFFTAGDPGEHLRALADGFHLVVRALAASPVPVVGALRGWAAGAGMSLVLGCDTVIATASARMRPAYPGIGLSPDGGMSWLLPRAVGRNRALDILLRNRVIQASEALELGLVHELVPDEELSSRAEAVALEYANGPTHAYGRIRRLVLDGDAVDLGTQLDAESASIAACAAHPEGREGVTAFAERRKPDFSKR